MNNDHILIAVIAVVVSISGCVDQAEEIMDDFDTEEEPVNSNGEHEESSPDTDRGLEIMDFKVLNPEIESREDAVGTTIELVLHNYHSDSVEIDEISIYDSSLLTIENRECTPSDIEGAELEPADTDYVPEIFCEWDVVPPQPDEFGSFDQRTFSPRLHLQYESILENEDPIAVEFKDRDDIREMTSLGDSFTNNEVSMTKTVEQNPIPSSDNKDTTRTIDYELRNDGPGILGDMPSGEDFKLEFNPEDTYQGSNCDDGEFEASIDIGSSAEFSCELGFDQEVTRNLFTSVRYKYIKEPSIDITVVS